MKTVQIPKGIILGLLAFVLCGGLWVMPARAEENYDGYSFRQWVSASGDKRASSFQKFYGTYYLNMGGTGNNGVSFTFVSAGNDEYYLKSKCGYDVVYLTTIGTNSDGEYYLGGTTSTSSALKWRLGQKGSLITTKNSTEYVLWMYCNQLPYNGDDGFRLTTNQSKSDRIYYPSLTLTPPEVPHSHPICGASCGHLETHENIAAKTWSGGASNASNELAAGDYYLTEDVSVSAMRYISGAVRICLNGHNLTFTNGKGFSVRGGSSLVICDCQGGGSLNSEPKKESGASVYYNDTMTVAQNGALSLFGVDYGTSSGTNLVNNGSVSIHGGVFGKGLDNYGSAVLDGTKIEVTFGVAVYNNSGGTAELNECVLLASGKGVTIGNSFDAFMEVTGGSVHSVQREPVSNSGTMKLRDVEIQSETDCGIENRGALELTDVTVRGTIGINNVVWNPNTYQQESNCIITGGTIHGTECGVLNSGMSTTVSVDDVETAVTVKTGLEIYGQAELDKIVLEYPDAFVFAYSGTEPVDLEIRLGDEFAVGDVAVRGEREAISMLRLVNEGYELKFETSGSILAEKERCDTLGHSMGEWQTVKAPTCTEAGSQARSCGTCGHTEIESLPELGHDYEAEVTAPTCTTGGYTTHTCVRGDDTYQDTPVDALGHSMGEWQQTLAPTYTEAGAEKRTCKHDSCEEYEERSISATGPALVENVTVAYDAQTGTLKLENVPVDITVMIARYLKGRMVLAETDFERAGETVIFWNIPANGDEMKIFFLTEEYCPIADCITR